MVKRMVVMVAVSAGVAAGTVQAAGWDRPSLLMRLSAVEDSELFPGSTQSGADRAWVVEGVLGSERRLSATTRLGIEAEVAMQRWQRFNEATFAQYGLGGSLRVRATTLTLAGEWTPSRLKFPGTLDEGGVFERREWRAGVRQALSDAVRVRAEVRRRRDDFDAPHDVRDQSAIEGFGQLSLRVAPGLTLRAEGASGHAEAASRKYTQSERSAGGSLTARRGGWTLDAAFVSGASRYPDARSGDSNFRRRDQWLESRATLRRVLGGGVTALAGAQWYDQTSTRPDRTYTTHELRLGLEWAVDGE